MAHLFDYSKYLLEIFSVVNTSANAFFQSFKVQGMVVSFGPENYEEE